jgi:cob(I)alamin adenosyltransferase
MPRRQKPMVELTGGGDDGTTGLLGGGRLAKDDLRIEAYGTVDEASSAIGFARALAGDATLSEILEALQAGLYRAGAELATNPDQDGRFATIAADDVVELEALTARLETEAPMPTGFILPGATVASGAIDLARTVVRRAERRCVALGSAGGIRNPQLLRYLNRMSLLLFVAGRYAEHVAGQAARPARSPGAASRPGRTHRRS